MTRRASGCKDLEELRDFVLIPSKYGPLSIIFHTSVGLPQSLTQAVTKSNHCFQFFQSHKSIYISYLPLIALTSVLASVLTLSLSLKGNTNPFIFINLWYHQVLTTLQWAPHLLLIKGQVQLQICAKPHPVDLMYTLIHILPATGSSMRSVTHYIWFKTHRSHFSVGVCLGKSLYASEPSIKWGQFFMLCRVMRLIAMPRKCPVNSSNDYYAMLLGLTTLRQNYILPSL